MLSKRSQKPANFLYSGWKKHSDDPYHSDTNPNGIVNLGVAENKLISEDVLKKLSCINYRDFDEAYLHYCNFNGVQEFRNKLAVFFNHFMNPSIHIAADDIVVMNGGGTVIETLGAAICDENEGFLVPAPYYTTFKSDLESRFNTKLYPVKLSGNDPEHFRLSKEKLQNAYNEASQNSIKIKGLIISNPINPLGINYSVGDLELCLDFCYSNGMHLVCDEVYMLSVYDNQHAFTNVLSLKCIKKYMNIIHVVWGFSKDFGLSGFRCGVAITYNNDMKKTLSATGYHTSVPTPTQYVLTELISDIDWIKSIQTINHKRLKEARDMVASILTKAHIPYLIPNSGLFLVFNVSPYMKNGTFAEEDELFERFLNTGVFIVPGKIFEFSEPGWFRIVIANETKPLITGVQRIIQPFRL